MINLELLSAIPFLALGAIIGYLFLFKNPGKKYGIPFLICVGLWVLVPVANATLFNNSMYLAEIFVALAAVIYFLRVRKFENKKAIDYLKVACCFGFAIAEWLEPDTNRFLYQSFFLSTIITVFIFDRVINYQLPKLLNSAGMFAYGLVVATMIVFGGKTGIEKNECSEKVYELHSDQLEDQEAIAHCNEELIECGAEVNELSFQLQNLTD